MKKAIGFAVVTTISLSGCGSLVYTKYGASPSQAARDEQECRYEAEKATASISNVMMQAHQENELTTHCMELRGYRQELQR